MSGGRRGVAGGVEAGPKIEILTDVSKGAHGNEAGTCTNTSIALQ